VLALQRLLKRQENEIRRLTEEGEAKSKAIQLLERKLSVKNAIHRKYNLLKSAFDRLKTTHEECCKSLRERFSWLRQDQITALLRKSTRGLKWSAETLRDGLMLKMRCGTSGFAQLVKMVPIYPAVRSLQSYVQFVQFRCGILEDILTLMEVAVASFKDQEKDCHLTLDELAIEPGERLDFSTKQWVGAATLPSHIGIAEKGLVLLLAGVSRRWKQVVRVATHLAPSKK